MIFLKMDKVCLKIHEEKPNSQGIKKKNEAMLIKVNKLPETWKSFKLLGHVKALMRIWALRESLIDERVNS